MDFPAYTGGYIDFCWLVPSPPGSDTSGPPGHLSLEIQSISTRSPTSLCGAWWLVDFRFNSTVNYMCTCIYIYIHMYIHIVYRYLLWAGQEKRQHTIGTNANFSFFNALKPKVPSKFKSPPKTVAIQKIHLLYTSQRKSCVPKIPCDNSSMAPQRSTSSLKKRSLNHRLLKPMVGDDK